MVGLMKTLEQLKNFKSQLLQVGNENFKNLFPKGCCHLLIAWVILPSLLYPRFKHRWIDDDHKAMHMPQ